MITKFTKTTIPNYLICNEHVRLGFLGVEDDYPEQKSSLPIKKKRNQVLTKEEESTIGIILQKG